MAGTRSKTSLQYPRYFRPHRHRGFLHSDGPHPVPQVPDPVPDLGYTALDRNPSAFRIIPQTPYRCATRRRGWVPQPPIEFEGVKLTDAASLRYPEIPDQDDEVFSCEDVGGSTSISCVLNVSYVSALCDHSFTPPAFASFLVARPKNWR